MDRALGVLSGLIEAAADPGDDGVFGPALVRAGVAGSGRPPIDVETYIKQQRRLPVGGQSMRTTARGMRELLAKLGLIHSSRAPVSLTPLGQHVIDSAPPDDAAFRALWRGVVEGVTAGEQPHQSHPYQVLLRLVARRPGISRAKCALALEARNDSDAELDRIAKLSDLDEGQIRKKIGESQSNWDNAKKILPSFAEQLFDVIKEGNYLYLSDTPGNGKRSNLPPLNKGEKGQAAKSPRTSRKVSPDTIGQAGLAESDEPPIPPDLDPAKLAAAIATRADRLRRHNLLVRQIASSLKKGDLFEDPFDLLLICEGEGILVEVKTLNGEIGDEVDRVRGALAQLLYYEAFVTSPYAKSAPLKCAAFELKPSDEHIIWLESKSILTIWKYGDLLFCRKTQEEDLLKFFPTLNA